MANQLDEQITRLKVKSDMLVSRYRAVEAERAGAKAEIAALKLRNESLEKDKEQLEKEREFLIVSSAISPDYSSLEMSRHKISELIRDIDRCIAELEA